MARQGKKTKINLLKSIIGEKAYNKIGTYEEYAGGGDVIEKGEDFKIVDNVEEAEEYREEHPGESVRVKQPRLENGQFGHMVLNKRERKYEDRSETLPDFLQTPYVKLPMKLRKGEIVTAEGRVYISQIKMPVEKVIALLFSYQENEWKKLENAIARVKQGRRSKKEKESLSESGSDVIFDNKEEGVRIAYDKGEKKFKPLEDSKISEKKLTRYRDKYGKFSYNATGRRKGDPITKHRVESRGWR